MKRRDMLTSAVGVAAAAMLPSVGMSAELKKLSDISKGKMMKAKITATPVLRQAWDKYLAALDEMRERTEATACFQDTPQHRAKAYHTLMELQAFGYNWAITPRQSVPRVYRNLSWQTDVYTLGQNGPDMLYLTMFVDGGQTYRITGRVGDVVMTTLQTHDGLPGIKADGKVIGEVTGHYDWDNYQIDRDGHFEITVSAGKHAGNWIKLNPSLDYQCLLVRRMLPKWLGDAGEFNIELINELPTDYYDAEEFEEATMAARIRRAEAWIRFLTVKWNIGLYDMYIAQAGGRRNVLSPFPGDNPIFQMGNRTTTYTIGVFEHADDEALIIEVEKPDGIYWSYQLGDVWGRSLPYANGMGSLNSVQAVVDNDNMLRVVLSHRDPGVANWLDTARRNEGAIALRNYKGTTKQAPPTVRRVKFAEIDKYLPATTKRITLIERKAVIEQRRLGQRKMIGE